MSLQTTLKDLRLKRRQWFYLAGIGIALVLLLYSLVDNPDQADNASNKSELYQQNQAYLAKAEKEATDQFLKLAAIEGLLKTAQSSQVGISFLIDAQVTIGNELTVLTQLVHDTEEITLLSGISSLSIRILLKTADILTPLLYKLCLLALMATLLCLLIPKYLGNIGTLAYDLLYLSALALLLTYLILPYSVNATAQLAEFTTKELRTGAQQHIVTLHEKLIVSDKKPDIKDRAEGALSAFKKIVEQKLIKTEDLASHYARYKTATILEGIVFPLMLSIVLLLLCRRLLRQARALLPGTLP